MSAIVKAITITHIFYFQSKDTALNIAVAQGIVFTISGDENMHGDESATTENPYCNDETFNNFLNGVIGFVSDPNPCSRNSTAIWLLALVKNFSNRLPIYSRKQTLQFAFTELLSDDSEFIQDVASRGLVCCSCYLCTYQHSFNLLFH